MLFVYTKNSALFLTRIQEHARTILSTEAFLSVRKAAFCWRDLWYQFEIVVFEHPRTLGYFDPTLMEIGLNKRLMLLKEDAGLLDILRHEIAHMLTHVNYGHVPAPHGQEYHRICMRCGWGPSVSSASVDLSEATGEGGKEKDTDRVLERVKKLLALATSENDHEAHLATFKANQLLLRHNLRTLEAAGLGEDEEVCVKRVLEFPRANPKISAIRDILRTFLVAPVLNHGRGVRYLEVTGDRTNVEIAEYVASFLDSHLEHLWRHAKNTVPGLSGVRGRNSFMRGVAKGYLEKVKAGRKAFAPEETMALVKIEGRLEEKLARVYPHLRHWSSRVQICTRSMGAGEQAGKELTIHRGIKDTGDDRFLLPG